MRLIIPNEKYSLKTGENKISLFLISDIHIDPWYKFQTQDL